MFFSVELLNLQKHGKFALVWIAATRGVKHLPQKDLKELNIVRLCEELEKYFTTQSKKPSDKMSLILSIKLLHGIVQIHFEQIQFLLKDLVSFLSVVRKPLMIRTEPSTATGSSDSGATFPTPIPRIKPTRNRPEVIPSEELSLPVTPQDQRPNQANPEDISLRDEVFIGQPQNDLGRGFGTVDLQQMEIIPPSIRRGLELLEIESTRLASHVQSSAAERPAEFEVQVIPTERDPEHADLPVAPTGSSLAPQDDVLTTERVQQQQMEVPAIAVEEMPPAVVAEENRGRKRRMVRSREASAQTRIFKDFSNVCTTGDGYVNINRLALDDYEISNYSDQVDVLTLPALEELALLNAGEECSELLDLYFGGERQDIEEVIGGDSRNLLGSRSSGFLASIARSTSTLRPGIVSDQIHATAAAASGGLSIDPTLIHPLSSPIHLAEAEQQRVTDDPCVSPKRKRTKTRAVEPISEEDAILPVAESTRRNIQESFSVETRAYPELEVGDDRDTARRNAIIQTVRSWDFDDGHDLTLEDLCEMPINKYNIAVSFGDVLFLAKGRYVKLVTRPNSLDLDYIMKGPKLLG